MTDEMMIEQKYELWRRCASEDADVAAQLAAMEKDPRQMQDAFYRDLTFGTGGLRGVIGAGTNRMNIYTVARASQGLAAYVQKNFLEEQRLIAVSYDSRIKSDVLARVAAEVFAGAGIRVWMYPELMPTPCLSFAVRRLSCAAGVMVTASHNPSRYNGYKVYGPDGCQITEEAAAQILDEIGQVELFDGVKRLPFDEGIAQGLIRYISDEVTAEFIRHVQSQSMLPVGQQLDKDVSIVYTPLNGTGLKPVLRTLRESGYTRITVVKEQEAPDGNFPTCPYPNPEIREAMELGVEYARWVSADLLLATDPDCDRVGIAVKDPAGEYVLLSGNETGMLLLDYICSMRTQNGRMPADPVAVKTIVTTDMAERIAAHYGVRCINVLTGFKYIGEQIGRLEAAGHADSYLFGFEESYGYLSGTYVRDKDGVNAAFLICEMFCYYRSQGISLYEKLEELYHTYGYCLNTLHSYTYEGASGFARMQQIMTDLRTLSRTVTRDCAHVSAQTIAGDPAHESVQGTAGDPAHDSAQGTAEDPAHNSAQGTAGDLAHSSAQTLGSLRVLDCLDYSQGLNGLPPSNVLKFNLEGNCSVVIRPSGTEPKIKLYISVTAPTRPDAHTQERQLLRSLLPYIQS